MIGEATKVYSGDGSAMGCARQDTPLVGDDVRIFTQSGLLGPQKAISGPVDWDQGTSQGPSEAVSGPAAVPDASETRLRGVAGTVEGLPGVLGDVAARRRIDGRVTRLFTGIGLASAELFSHET